MKKTIFILLAICLVAFSASDAGILILRRVGEAQATLGDTGIGANDGATSLQYCSHFTASESFTATYGYFYGNGDGSTIGVTMCIREDNSGDAGDTITNGCSTENTGVTTTPGWWEVTFSSASITQGNTYWICFSKTTGSDAIRYYYDTGSTGDTQYGGTICSTAPTVDYSRVPSYFVSNYDAH